MIPSFSFKSRRSGSRESPFRPGEMGRRRGGAGIKEQPPLVQRGDQLSASPHPSYCVLSGSPGAFISSARLPKQLSLQALLGIHGHNTIQQDVSCDSSGCMEGMKECLLKEVTPRLSHKASTGVN